jgi:hypothetical protein
MTELMTSECMTKSRGVACAACTACTCICIIWTFCSSICLPNSTACSASEQCHANSSEIVRMLDIGIGMLCVYWTMYIWYIYIYILNNIEHIFEMYWAHLGYTLQYNGLYLLKDIFYQAYICLGGYHRDHPHTEMTSTRAPLLVLILLFELPDLVLEFSPRGQSEESCAIVPRSLDGIWWNSMEVLWNYGIPENTGIPWYSMLKDTCILLNSHDFWRFSWISMNSQESSWILMTFHEFWSNTTKKHDFKSLHFWITTRLQVARLVLGIHGCQLCTSTVGFLMEVSGLQCGSIRKNRESVCVLYIYTYHISM